MKILLAVDDKNLAEDSTRALSYQQNPQSTEVRVLHVVEPISVSVPPQMDADFTPEISTRVRESREAVEEIAEKLRITGFKADGVVKKGEVRDTILENALDWKADLIVLGSHGRRGIRRFLLGSVAESVARHAPCSVEIVRSVAA
jgi:nucleotide-binding universal stress UspA family protein